MTSLSSTENETASPCVPSRRVVSKVWIRIMLLGAGGGLLFFRHTRLFLLFQKWHHLAQLAAYFFYRLILGRAAHRQELVTPGLVLMNPLAREMAGADLSQNLFHLCARFGVYHAGAARIVAVLGRVRH